MKVIRNRLRYDVGASTKILSDVIYKGNETDLYKTDNDNWFLFCEKRNDFIPLDIDGVIEVLEIAGEYDLIETYFNDVIKDA